MLETREDLAAALTIAAELEHGLLLQYLFAALTLKKDAGEGISWPQAEQCRQWERRVLVIARQEMVHLGTVCNLLSAIGEAPHFVRPNFPQPAGTAYPFDFELSPYSDETLFRFVRAELPKGEPPPEPPHRTGMMELASFGPAPILYDFVGELYAQIEDAFLTLEGLFIGPAFAQDTSGWSNNFQIVNVTDKASAKRAIDAIVQQGEGAPGHRAGSHYDTFLGLRRELKDAGYFAAGRPVVKNPCTTTHRDAATGTIITNESTKSVAVLFNEVYETVLLMLMQYYSYSGETPSQMNALREAIRTSMSMAIRPISEVLTRLPVVAGADVTAGPPFEVSIGLRLPTQLPNRWTLLQERFAGSAVEARRLSKVDQRLSFVGENLALIGGNLKAAAT